jgi:hypothetical protein
MILIIKIVLGQGMEMTVWDRQETKYDKMCLRISSI